MLESSLICILFLSHSVLSSSHLPPPESPGSEDSPAGSPSMVVNGNSTVNGQGTGSTTILGHSPEVQQLSPLTSPLLTDAGCIRNDDDEEARRKVGIYVTRIILYERV